MKTSLTILKGKPLGLEIPLETGQYVVGRDDSCRIRLASDSVSRMHCQFDVSANATSISDMGSRNGTFVNKVKISAPVELRHGDTVQVGNVLFGVRIQSVPPSAGAGTKGARKRPPAPDSSSVNSAVIAGWLNEGPVRRRPYVLLIERSEPVRTSFSKILSPLGYGVEAIDSIVEGINLWPIVKPNVVVIDKELWQGPEFESFDRFAQGQRDTALIILDDGATTAARAIDAMQTGAYDVLSKPLDPARVREVVGKAVKTSREAQRAGTAAVPALPVQDGDGPLVGNSPAMQSLYKSIARVAATDEPVLILGESGSGKEMVAQIIHQRSGRAAQQMIEVRCGTAPESQIERKLFGYERGAFPEASRRRIGTFEQWPDGSVVLYEVEKLSLDAQVRLMSLIQKRQFTRIGGHEPVSSNARLIAVSAADLTALAAAGNFRSDLLLLMRSFSIHVPALRERIADIDLLTNLFVTETCRALSLPRLSVSRGAREALRSYNWPNNLRELRSVLREAILRAQGRVLQRENIQFGTTSPSPKSGRPPVASTPVPPRTAEPAGLPDGPPRSWEDFLSERLAAGSQNLYAECLQFMERELIMRTLRHVQGDQAKAAKVLGLTQAGLLHKLKPMTE